MLKIIGGERRGAKLLTLEGEATRPLRGRVREALFSILQWDVPDARVLDLFAGSGAIGLEALSRGASFVTFVENSPQASEVIRRNIEKLRYDDRSTLLSCQLPGGLKAVKRVGGGFTLVFLMPSYHSGLGWQTLEILGRCGLLAPEATVVHEIEKQEEWALPEGWALTDNRAYGLTRLLFLRPSDPSPLQGEH